MSYVHCDFSRRRSAALLATTALFGLIGCGGRSLYPVEGKVVWENGTEARELDGGLVVCESVDGAVGSRGDIQKDGSFRLGTFKPGDGARLGKHRVAVVENKPGEPPPAADHRSGVFQRQHFGIGNQRRAEDEPGHRQGAAGTDAAAALRMLPFRSS